MSGIPGDLAAELHCRYGLRGRAENVTAGLSASTMWRLNSVPPVMVRVSKQWPPYDQVQRSCAVAAGFAESVPLVPKPLIARDGSAVFKWQERPVAVWPFIDGNPLDRDDSTQRQRAAQLLAALHRAALNLNGPAPDPSASTYATRPAEPDPAGVPADPELDDWLHRWREYRRADEPHGWLHGDFFHGNILCRSGDIVGLIDWDDAQYGPLVTELAAVTWEFACASDRDTLARDRTQDFLNAYTRSGGPVHVFQDIVPLIRVRIRGSIAFFRRLQTLGHEFDPGLERASIAAFIALRHFTLGQ